MGMIGRITVAAVLGAVITVGQCWLLALQAVPTTFTVPVVPGATYSWPAPVPATWPACKESIRWRGIGMKREQASDQNTLSSRLAEYFVTRDVLGRPMGAMESVRREYLPLSGAGVIRVEDVGLESGIRMRRGSGPSAFESFLPLRPLGWGSRSMRSFTRWWPSRCCRSLRGGGRRGGSALESVPRAVMNSPGFARVPSAEK